MVRRAHRGAKIAALAESHHVPVAPHDCTGPVVYAASCHFSMFARNTLIQESVRAFYTGWYTELVTALPVVKDGQVTVDFTKPWTGARAAARAGQAGRRVCARQPLTASDAARRAPKPRTPAGLAPRGGPGPTPGAGPRYFLSSFFAGAAFAAGAAAVAAAAAAGAASSASLPPLTVATTSTGFSFACTAVTPSGKVTSDTCSG